MKNIAVIMMLFILVVGINTGCTTIEGNVNVLTINDVKSDPTSFTGEITISGVNAGVYEADPKIFFVVDTAELLSCKNLSCGAYRLPAIYKGTSPMPKVADEVNITGTWGKHEIEGKNGKENIDLFTVRKIVVKRNIMNILKGNN
jgi:hypothetical protein